MESIARIRAAQRNWAWRRVERGYFPHMKPLCGDCSARVCGWCSNAPIAGFLDSCFRVNPPGRCTTWPRSPSSGGERFRRRLDWKDRLARLAPGIDSQTVTVTTGPELEIRVNFAQSFRTSEMLFDRPACFAQRFAWPSNPFAICGHSLGRLS